MLVLIMVLMAIVVAKVTAPKWTTSEVSQNSSDSGMWIVGVIFVAIMAIAVMYDSLEAAFTNYGNRLKDTSTKVDPGTWSK